MSSKKQFKYDVSVVIPVYNAEKFLNQCVDSVLKQKYNQDKIQIILINDGSKDNSDSICKEYENKHNNVLYINQENKGVSAARNNGMKHSLGKYIMFLDSDDFLSNNTINLIVDFFNKHYEEIDLVTYPLIWYFDNNNTYKTHPRYNLYNKGTGVYDLREYYTLNQSTINVVVKNRFKDNILFDENMHLSEDQKHNTTILMEKEKIGYVKEAEYYYRRTGMTVAATMNNPIFCFDDIMDYNYYLASLKNKEGKIPKYIQSLIINTIDWRLVKDELFPYSLEEKKFKKAQDKIYNLINNIDVSTIANLNVSVYSKLFYLKIKNKKYVPDVIDNSFVIKCEGNIIYSEKKAKFETIRFKLSGDKLVFFANIVTPFLEFDDVKLYINKKYKNGENVKEKIDLFKANKPRIKSDGVNLSVYNIDLELDYKNLKSFNFILEFDGFSLPVRLKKNIYVPIYITNDKYVVYYGKKAFNFGYVIAKNNFKTRFKCVLMRDKEVLKVSPIDFVKRIIYRMLLKKNVWIYGDSNNNIDNGYYQFKHDIKMKDGIKRYYVTNLDQDLSNYFTKEERKYLIERNSFKHKVMFLSADKILTSFTDLSVYCPFDKKIMRFNDLKHYELIYLQHGILHANLINMYSKEYKEIDKFVISSEFEKENLIKNYNYKEEELIKSTMPRYSVKEVKKGKSDKKKILIAPSWRKYLIGELKNNKRKTMSQKFLASDYYKEFNGVMNSDKLSDILKKNNIELHIKMHPIFKEYNKYFNPKENIKIIEDNISLEDYDLFITDFSSFQFDYVKKGIPIIYFVPDYKEFISGLHTYRKLDLPYEKAFGKLCETSDELILEIEKIIKREFKAEKKYADCMSKFFYKVDNPCEYIYKELIGDKRK